MTGAAARGTAQIGPRARSPGGCCSPGAPAIGEIFRQAGRLADGTLVITGSGPARNGGKGTHERKVDTLRPTGWVCSSPNSTTQAYRLVATRPTPLLSTYRLTVVARSRAWREA